MRRALIVYESLFGNAHAAAESVAEGLRDDLDVRIVDAAHAPAVIDNDVDLVVVGGPTHQLGMTRPASRRQAASQYSEAPAEAKIGLREWLSSMQAPTGTKAAAFDTHLKHPWILRKLDHASRSEQRILRRHGLRPIARANGFLVESATGPMVDGELDRAREWGRELAGLVAASPPQHSSD